MKILLDITHPAHVHFYKYAIQDWLDRGHQIIITGRDKDLTLYLLEKYGLPHTVLSKARQGILGLGLELLERDRRLLGIVRRERPDVLTGIGGTFIAPVGKLLGIPVVVFTDTEHAKISNRITFPLSNVICTPACYEQSIGRKHLRYEGYQELAYLHPGRFTPDPTVLENLDISPEEPYIIMRLVGWHSGHDIGDRGFTDLRHALHLLSDEARVMISSEGPLPNDLTPYRFQAPPEKIHHLLAFAKLYIGESATMASESGMLGVPSILISTSTRGYTNELERKYDLVYTYSNRERAQHRGLQKAKELLQRPDLQCEWKKKRDRMVNDKIDVTQFIVDTVERFARSTRP